MFLILKRNLKLRFGIVVGCLAVMFDLYGCVPASAQSPLMQQTNLGQETETFLAQILVFATLKCKLKIMFGIVFCDPIDMFDL